MNEPRIKLPLTIQGSVDYDNGIECEITVASCGCISDGVIFYKKGEWAGFVVSFPDLKAIVEAAQKLRDQDGCAEAIERSKREYQQWLADKRNEVPEAQRQPSVP